MYWLGGICWQRLACQRRYHSFSCSYMVVIQARKLKSSSCAIVAPARSTLDSASSTCLRL